LFPTLALYLNRLKDQNYMKKNLLFYTVLLVIPFMSFLFLSNSNGAPSTGGAGFTAGVTGSPGDGGSSCTVCHGNAGSYGSAATISSNIPVSGFDLNTTYQITAEDPTNTKVGTFTISDFTNTKVDGAGHYVTQTTTGTSIKSWTFDWKSPKVFTGNITLYAATLSSNVTGDIKSQTVTTSYSVGGVLAVNKNQLLKFNMYPNPSDGIVNFQLPANINHTIVEVFNYLGKKIMQKEMTTTDNTLNVAKLSTGIYIVKIQSDSKTGTRKLIVK